MTSPDRSAIDRLIADCDRRLGALLDGLLHHPALQALEATWRALWLLVSRTDPASGVSLEILHCRKDELAADLRDAPEAARSGLYHCVYTRAIGAYGAAPYGLVCAEFDFGSGPEDIYILRQCAAIAAAAHAPFVANLSPALLGLDHHAALPRVRDLAERLAAPQLATWRALRALDDARYLGLCLPRFLLRPPHDDLAPRDDPPPRVALVDAQDPPPPLPYRERAGPAHADFLWGRASYLFALLAAAAFARDRWCVHLLGPAAAATAALPVLPTPSFPDFWRRLPLECQLAGRSERELAAEGLIAFSFARESGRARLFAAPSLHRPAADAPPGERLGAELPYLFLAARLAHYLKCVQRELVGSWQDHGALERALQHWLRQYVADQDDIQPEVRARRPLRRAAVVVEPAGDGWCRCRLELVPHLAHNSAAFSLSLLSRLERPSLTP